MDSSFRAEDGTQTRMEAIRQKISPLEGIAKISDWTPLLKELEEPNMKSIGLFVEEERKEFTIYPSKGDVFNAFAATPLSKVKVVVLGQDPYHGPHQAHGLAFSVKRGTTIPPSLLNIFKEIKQDLNIETPFQHGCLEQWAERGVLLLNSVLTVRAGEANSHASIGWQLLTDKAISLVNEQDRPIVYLLFGALAKSKASLINNPLHKVIIRSHPSPLSAYRDFLGTKPFSQCNDHLINESVEPIDWSIT